jgi:hypothetical protein
VSYRTRDGGEVKSAGVQYNLSESNTVKVTVPQSGKLQLTGGVINCDHMGDPLGSHRDPAKVLGAGLDPNFSAVNAKGVYCVLPDISLGDSSTPGAPSTGGSGGGGGCDSGAGLLGAALVFGCYRGGYERKKFFTREELNR